MKLYSLKLIGSFLLLLSTNLCATTINYTATKTGDRWQYDYSVSNDTLINTLNEFSVYFDVDMYENLTAMGAPTGWSEAVVQPGAFLGLSDGYYDAFSVAGIGAAETTGLFSVQFDWLVDGNLPAEQVFEILDPITFVVIDEGLTLQAQTDVPLPGALWLFISGLLALGLKMPKRNHNTF